MSLRSRRDGFIDWFIPAKLLADREMRTRARMFMFSHLFGPFLGNVIPAYLFIIDRQSHATLAVLAASITSFWLYPVVLRLTGLYYALSYLSIQNLLFAILWGCFFYGGVSSPFLPWLVTVPLLAFFYLGASALTIAAILSQVALNGLLFVFAYCAFGETELHLPLGGLEDIGVISTVSAAIYVSMMAIYHARVLDSQTELEAEVAGLLAAAAELRADAAKADRAGAAKTDFLAKMSHELRTPLNAIMNYSQMLLEDADASTESQVISDLERIYLAGGRLLSIVNSILDLSKIEAGKMSVDLAAVDVGSLVADLMLEHSQAARVQGTSLRAKVAPEVGTIETDALKLARILGTLLSNALAFSKGGAIVVEALADGADTVEFVVTDNGIGISPELMPILFEDFAQRSNSFASSFAGAGLGLPLAHRLCRLMGASIRLDSTVGIGTRATVCIPRIALIGPPAVQSTTDRSIPPRLAA